MMRKLVAVVLVVFVQVVLAEPSHDSGSGRTGGSGGTATGGTATGATRPAGDNQLREKELTILKSSFPNLGESYIKATYGETWPKAVAKATGSEKDETDTAKIMAQLFGTIEKGQRDAIVTLVEAERQKELDRETNRDQKYLDLLNRLYWAGKALQGTLIKDPEAQEFLKKFVGENLDFKSGEFKKIKDQNEEILQKMRDAQAGNKEAKKFLRENVNRDALLPFIDHHLKKGDKKLANNLADAVSWDINGQKFIDMIGPNNEQQRLYLGTSSDSISKAIAAFSQDKGGFFSNQLAQEPFSAPAKEWHVGPDGRLATGRPAGLETPPAATDGQKSQTQPPAQSNSGSGGGGGSTGGAFNARAASTFITNRCASCHAMSGSGNSAADFKITKNGKTFTLRQALAAIEAGTGGMNTSVPDAVKAELRAFANAR